MLAVGGYGLAGAGNIQRVPGQKKNDDRVLVWGSRCARNHAVTCEHGMVQDPCVSDARNLCSIVAENPRCLPAMISAVVIRLRAILKTVL